MNLHSIMVHMDQSADALARLALARDLAAGPTGRLIGVAAAKPLATPLGRSSPVILAEREQRLSWALATIGEHFSGGAQGVACEWRSAFDVAADHVSRNAGAADLIVVGRASRESAGPEFYLPPADAVMRAGRAVLVVPPGVRRLSGKRIVVSWKAGRPARLAVQLALPLLARADEVVVLGVGEETSEPELADVRDHLRRHDIEARHLWRALDGHRVEQVILDEMRRNSADLLVCGAYGRPQALEWALGGVTSALLDACPYCCLMAH